MSCPDIAFESAFLQAMGRVNRYEVADNTILLKKDDDVLVIVREQ